MNCKSTNSEKKLYKDSLKNVNVCLVDTWHLFWSDLQRFTQIYKDKKIEINKNGVNQNTHTQKA